MNISALHNENFQSIDVIQKQIKNPDIYWFDQVYNKPHKDEIPPTPYSRALFQSFDKLRIIDDKVLRDIGTETGIVHQLFYHHLLQV